MASSYTSSNGTNIDADRTTTVAESGLPPQEGQLLQSITNLQSQFDAMSQRQDELMQLVGVLRETQGGSVSGPSGDVLTRTDLSRGSDPYETLGPALPAGTGGKPPTSNHGLLHMPEQPHNMPAIHRPAPGRPVTQKTPPSTQDQVRGPGQPTFCHFDSNGRPLIHPLPPPQSSFPPFPHPVPVFSQLHDRTGHVIGLVRQGSFSLSERTGAGPGVHCVPSGWNQPQTYQPPVYPQMQCQVHPRMQPRMTPQAPPPPQLRPPPQIMLQGPTPTNWDAPPGPPPAYPGPLQASGELTPGTNHADPSTRPDGSGLYFPPIPGREMAGNGPMRANPPRKARPKDLSE